MRLRTTITEERLEGMVQDATGDDATTLGEHVIELVAEVRHLEKSVVDLLVAHRHRTEEVEVSKQSATKATEALKEAVRLLDYYTKKENFRVQKFRTGRSIHYSIPNSGPREAKEWIKNVKKDEDLEWVFKRDEDHDNYIGD